MGVLNDVYMVIDKQVLAEQEVLNVYFYRQNSVDTTWTAVDMTDSFIGQVLPAVAAIQSDRVLHTAVSAVNLFNPSDLHEAAVSVPGDLPSADDAATFDAVGFKLVQDNGLVKNGAKRYAGMPDAEAHDGVIDDTDYLALLATLSAALTGTLDIGILSVWVPSIVKRILVSAGKYRLPENQGEAVVGSITDAILNIFQTSQVSRKIGVGA